jgi:protein FAM32A
LHNFRTMTKTAFMGGSLSFKGDKKSKKAKKKKSKSKHSIDDNEEKNQQGETPLIDNPDIDDELTDAEKKALEKRQEREKAELEKIAAKSHRERIEEFNEKLGNLTELNDIPRVRVVVDFFVLIVIKSSSKYFVPLLDE